MPERAQPCLEAIARIREAVEGKWDAARTGALYEEIIAGAAAIEEPLPAVLAPGSSEHRLAFARAVLSWMTYAQAGGNVVVDTLRCRTLSRFPLDFEPSEESKRILRAALAQTFDWPVGQLGELEAELLHLTSNLRVKTSVAAAIAELFHQQPSAHRLMERTYGPLPFREDEVGLIVTNSGVFFCLPERGESDATRAFLEKVDRENVPATDRFPSFGWFDREAVDPRLIEEITAKLNVLPELRGIRPEVVKESFATMVQLLPAPHADQYIIHDNWGHAWQEVICEFEWLYAKLARTRDPIAPDTGPFFGGEGTPRLVDAFRGPELDVAQVRAILERDLAGRVLAGINGIFAEMLADLVEHKYVRHIAPLGEVLPTSSIFPHAPLKLDLTLADVESHLDLAFSAYRSLASDERERARLTAALESAGAFKAGLRARVDRTAELCARELGEDARSALRERIMLQAAALDRALALHLQRATPGEGPLWHTPSASIDLLVLSLAWFYERDRSESFWHLPALVREGLAPTMQRLEQAISRSR